jgi:hypothetical protein
MGMFYPVWYGRALTPCFLVPRHEVPVLGALDIVPAVTLDRPYRLASFYFVVSFLIVLSSSIQRSCYDVALRLRCHVEGRCRTWLPMGCLQPPLSHTHLPAIVPHLGYRRCHFAGASGDHEFILSGHLGREVLPGPSDLSCRRVASIRRIVGVSD